MKKLYCVTCGKYRKFEQPKISYIFEKTLLLSIIYSNFKNEDEKIFKEEEFIEILKILGLVVKIVIVIVKNFNWLSKKHNFYSFVQLSIILNTFLFWLLQLLDLFQFLPFLL